MKTGEWSVYLVECSDHSLYCGITKNIEKRIKAHNKGKGAKYTRMRRPVKLIEVCSDLDLSLALRTEYYIKSLERKKKEPFLRNFKKRKVIVK